MTRNPLSLLGSLALALGGCFSPTGSEAALRIKINNAATGSDVRVVVDGPRFEAVTVNVPAGEQRNVYPRGEDGDILSFTVTVPTNAGVSGSGNCTAGPEMAANSEGDVHGQVDLGLESGTTIAVLCSGAGLPGGGWR